MSDLTLKLLRTKPATRNAAVWKKRFNEIADSLTNEYGRSDLGNLRDPVREVLYIVLSARTTEQQYRNVRQKLFRAYPTIQDLARAHVRSVRSCIAECGLSNRRAPQLIQLAKVICRELGPHASRRLKNMTPEDAYTFLLTLPGVGAKSALCVLLFSKDCDVFPVDVHVRRVAARLGAISSEWGHDQAQAFLPALIPEGRSRDLHVSLVTHGRRVCVPRKPRCDDCTIVEHCRHGARRNRFAKSRGGENE